VQDPPSRLADHGDWPRRQARATQETGALTRPAAKPAQAFFRLLVHPTRAGAFKAATGLGKGKQPPAKRAGATPLPDWLKFKNRDWRSPKRSPHSATVKAVRSREGGSGRCDSIVRHERRRFTFGVRPDATGLPAVSCSSTRAGCLAACCARTCGHQRVSGAVLR
jgi:hypothetical protein